jgi:hypothetical protein
VLTAMSGFSYLGLGVLGVLIFVLWVAGIVDVVRRTDLDRTHRAAWILIIVLLPLVGTILYFVMRPTLPDERDGIIAAQTRRHR